MDEPIPSVEASDLGWKPGAWPHTATHEGKTYAFVKFHRDHEGDVEAATYETERGEQLLVFND